MTFVYVISAGELHQKVGITANLGARLSALQTGHYHKLSVVFSIEDDDAAWIEHQAHALLREKRLQGEWFMVSVEDAVRAVKQALTNSRTFVRRPYETGEVVVCIEGPDKDCNPEPLPILGEVYTIAAVEKGRLLDLEECPNDEVWFDGFLFRRLDQHEAVDLTPFFQKPGKPK